MNDIVPSIQIGLTRELDETRGIDVGKISDVDEIFGAYITDVVLHPADSHYSVDSFRLLYALIGCVSSMAETSEFYLDIGEGLEIAGRIMDYGEQLFELTVPARTANHKIEFHLSKPQLLIFLMQLASDLIRSISRKGIDVNWCVRKFPPALF